MSGISVSATKRPPNMPKCPRSSGPPRNVFGCCMLMRGSFSLSPPNPGAPGFGFYKSVQVGNIRLGLGRGEDGGSCDQKHSCGAPGGCGHGSMRLSHGAD